MKNMIISTVIAGTLLLVIGNPVNQLVTESEAVEVAEVSSVSAAAVAECGRCSEFRKEVIALREDMRQLRLERIAEKRDARPRRVVRSDGGVVTKRVYDGQVPVDAENYTEPQSPMENAKEIDQIYDDGGRRWGSRRRGGS